METLFILIRTSRRPEGFRVLMESIRNLEYPNVCTIVHTDDPRDSYVEGDIIIRGEVYPRGYGSAPYNLYQNRLLQAVPHNGWVHFVDDDDCYTKAEAFNFLNGANKTKMQVCKVSRWDGKIFPKKWKKQNSFQTECFVLWSGIAKKFKWWAEKGGDHYYTRQVTRVTQIDWHDTIICEAQNGKGHGKRIDVNGEYYKENILSQHEDVWVRKINTSGTNSKKMELMPLYKAEVLEQEGYARITYKGVSINGSNKQKADSA